MIRRLRDVGRSYIGIDCVGCEFGCDGPIFEWVGRRWRTRVSGNPRLSRKEYCKSDCRSWILNVGVQRHNTQTLIWLLNAFSVPGVKFRIRITTTWATANFVDHFTCNWAQRIESEQGLVYLILSICSTIPEWI